MPVSDKLAFEIFTIVIFHVSAVVVLFSFSVYIFLRAKKTPLLYSYLCVVAMILLWMVSKILKTVSPDEGLRWTFIVTQYFGVDFLGLCLIVFAYIYTKGKVPSSKALLLLAIAPMVSFLVVLSNPLHMGFYAYYDFYKDRFGPLFYPTQFIHYGYLVTGIVMLAKGFTQQPGFRGKRVWARVFALIVLVSLLSNIYYLLFKLDVVEWVFPFPVFDFTPIACSITLILFMIPALTFRFFDISPITYGLLFKRMPQGIVFLDRKKTLYSGNSAFYHMFGVAGRARRFQEFADALPFADTEERQALVCFALEDAAAADIELRLINGTTYRVTKKPLGRGHLFLCFTDISALVKNKNELERQNTELTEVNRRLDVLAQNARELAIAKTKASLAQNVHDNLGHSLTVVIGMTELAAAETDMTASREILSMINEMLANSLNDVKNTFTGKENDWGQTSLIKAINHLKNKNIEVDFVTQGMACELNTAKTEAIFRLCQEAVTNSIKHGKAKTIHIVLRYNAQSVEVFAIDDGLGCGKIVKSLGLSGIEARLFALGGQVSFGSDGVRGFNIHARLAKDTVEETVKQSGF